MSESLDLGRVRAVLQQLRTTLLSELQPGGYWTGELSSSALSTAVAIIALHQMQADGAVLPGLHWLAEHANEDGGWGDTVRSQSNLSTTALGWAAFGAAKQDSQFRLIVKAAEDWLIAAAGSLESLPAAIVAQYGEDKTFSIPILMTLALSGRLGPDGWRAIQALPFELAAFPRSWFAALRLPVVSYALPALIGIGQALHFHAPTSNPLLRAIRDRLRKPTLCRLDQLQPSNGGFLEATPLTAFVTMSLASMGQRDHSVARRGKSFLEASMRPDGSWPIDTNLATWVTTLSVKALSYPSDAMSVEQKRAVQQWLLNQQFRVEHPYTGAAAGGWAWTDLPGGVPDADDTAGALLALADLRTDCSQVGSVVRSGIQWLLNLQNRDGGMPTFCRGWGSLPFDRSAPELTAHAMRTWVRWQSVLAPDKVPAMLRGFIRGMKYLASSQRADGAWTPLWFGNESAPSQENAVYGTAQTLISLNEMREQGCAVDSKMTDRAVLVPR